MINLSNKLLLNSAASVNSQKDGWIPVRQLWHNLIKQNQQNPRIFRSSFPQILLKVQEKTKKLLKKSGKF